MSADSTQTSLRDRLTKQREHLQAEIEHHNAQVTKVMRNSLDSLGETWSKSVSDVLEITETNIRAEARRLGMLWIRTMVVGLTVCVVIWFAAWAILQSLHDQIDLQADTLNFLERGTADARLMLQELETPTYGLRLREIEGVFYVLLPAGSEITGTIEGLAAVQLPR